MSLKILLERAKEFKISEESLKADENKRIEFITRFPLSSIKDLTLDEYVQGINKDTFCYWLEFKDIPFGIGGGNASKFGIYKSKDGQYYTGFDTNKRILVGKELEEKFSSIKNSIITSLDLTKQNKIEQIVKLESPIWKMILQKILSLYYPNKFITIGAPNVLIECARDINLEGCELIQENTILINYLIYQKLSNQPELTNWQYNKIGSFIWKIYEAESKKNYYILGSKYSGNKDVFPEMLKRSVISTGFASTINLTDYYSKNHSEITDYLKGLEEEMNSYNALKHFLNIKLGDRIAIKSDGSPKGSKGFLSIIGIAEVFDKEGKIYEFDPESLGHIINVKFIKAPVYKEFELGG